VLVNTMAKNSFTDFSNQGSGPQLPLCRAEQFCVHHKVPASVRPPKSRPSFVHVKAPQACRKLAEPVDANDRRSMASRWRAGPPTVRTDLDV
jgi:hypothetical protein